MAGSATLTTVASMPAIAEPRMVASNAHRPGPEPRVSCTRAGTASGAAVMCSSDHDPRRGGA